MIGRTLTRRAIAAASRVLTPPLLALQRLRNVAPVLLYHRVAPTVDPAYPPLLPSEFDAHLEILTRYFRVLPLGELVDRAVHSRSMKGCCAITFDDGYADFREHAVPLLRRYDVPVTHFLVSDSVDRGTPPWTYRFNRIAVQHRWVRSAAREQQRALGQLDATSRDVWLRQREVDLHRTPLPAMLRAADVLALGGDLIEWGSHTAAHGFLTRLPEREVARELRSSRERLEAVTREKVRFLAYPNGFHDRATARAVEEAGYEAALAVGQELMTHKSHRFALPRFDVGGHPVRMMQLEATGLLGAVRRLRRG